MKVKQKMTLEGIGRLRKALTGRKPFQERIVLRVSRVNRTRFALARRGIALARRIVSR